MENILHIISLLGNGIVVTLEVFVFTLLFSLPLGLLICFGRQCKVKIVSAFFRLYISIMRGTPLMLQLFIVYYCPYYLFHIKLSVFGDNYRLIAVLIGFIMNYAAYFAEIYRSGIESMPIGQYEASKVLGYSRTQTFCVIILPQVIRRIIPTVTNEVITLVKDTSLAYTIGVIEMFTIAKQVSSAQTNITALLVAGVIYYILNFAVAYGMEQLEKRMNYYSIK